VLKWEQLWAVSEFRTAELRTAGTLIEVQEVNRHVVQMAVVSGVVAVGHGDLAEPRIDDSMIWAQ
jgi:hypothetical protein